MSSRKTLVIDLDGTLCEQVSYPYDDPAPRPRAIARVRELHEAGWIVIIHTARGMNTHGWDVRKAAKALYERTATWLARHGVPYEILMFGKPPGDTYVDDKGMHARDFEDGSAL